MTTILPWTKKDLLRLSEFDAAGMSLQEISKILGRTIASLRVKRQYTRKAFPDPRTAGAGIAAKNAADKAPKRPWTNLERRQLVQYLKAGKTNDWIAEKLNRHASTLRRHIPKHLLWSRRNRLWSQEEAAKLQDLLAEKKPLKEIAKILGRTYRSVWSKVKPEQRWHRRNKWTKADRKQLQEHLTAGRNLTEIAELMQRSFESVAYASRHFNGADHRPNNLYNRWLEEEILQLKEYVEDGYPIAQIAELMRRSFGSIKLQIEKCRFRRLDRALDYKKFFSSSHSIEGIAEKMGVTTRQVRYMRKKLIEAGYHVAQTHEELQAQRSKCPSSFPDSQLKPRPGGSAQELLVDGRTQMAS